MDSTIATPPTPPADRREHFWDSLRAVLMLLGIPYHAALSYMPDSQWIVKSGEGVPGFPELAHFIHLFRMPAFFVIAGYFAAMLLVRRAPGTWLKGRFRRLAIPFVTAIVLLVPAMNYACEISNLPMAKAWPSFLHNSANSGGYWVRHLWFIIVLLYLCTGAAALCAWRPRLRGAMLPAGPDRFVGRHLVVALLIVGSVVAAWEALAVEEFYILGLNTNLIQQILRIDELIAYLPWFAIGFFLQRSREAAARVSRCSPMVAFLAAVAIGAEFALRHDVHPATGRALAAFAALLSTQVLIAAARTLFDRPIPVVQRFTAASFVIYLFHLPVLCWLVFAGQYVAIPPLAKGLLVMAATLFLSYGAWLVIERSRLLALLFDGGMRPGPAGPERQSR